MRILTKLAVSAVCAASGFRAVSAAPYAAADPLTVVTLSSRVGRNTIIAKSGSQTTRLEVTNYPITGPLLSGEHLAPFVCNTVQSGLGEPLDADCSAR